MTESVSAILDKLREVYQESVPDVDQRTAAYWWGRPDESVAWGLSLCLRVAPDPIAQTLYLASVAEDVRHNREIKEWAYTAAAELAVQPRPGSKRNQPAVAAYDVGWARQAARDGVAIAMWPHLKPDIPGVTRRSERFGCRQDAYRYIRDGISDQARELIAWFRDDMDSCLKGHYRRDFIERWEAATGKAWSRI